ncbi:MAG: NADPH-dependent FMN reductase [Alphaproteobacteria bacterium]
MLKIAVQGAKDAGATVTTISLADIPLPIYDGDIESEQGMPANGRKLKDLFLSHDGLLIASPEYNGSLTAALKNALDWASPPETGEARLACYQGKVAGLVATGGGFGGARSLLHLRQILAGMGALVIPSQLTIANGAQAFDENGTLKDDRQRTSAASVGASLASTVAKTTA